MEQEIGKVTHYYGKASVAVVKLSAPLQMGETIVVKGKDGTERFRQVVASLQVDFKPVESVAQGDEVAIKVTGKVHDGDLIFK